MIIKRLKKIVDNKDNAGAVLLLLLCLIYLRAIFSIPDYKVIGEEFVTAKTLPLVLVSITICVCFLQLLLPSAKENNTVTITESVKGFHWRPAILLMLLMLAYALFFDFLGFILASILFLMGGFFILGEKRVIVSVSIGVGLTFFIWVLLTQLFDVYLGTGRLYLLLSGGV